MDLFGMDTGGIENALGGIGGVMNMITSEIEQPIKSMVQQVLGGIWKGKGADAFVQMINGQATKSIDTATSQLTTYKNNISKCSDTIAGFDGKGASQASELEESFDF